ncbi:hypothetical protein HMPREF1549_00830 [Actinomyces johnsonii F0510]|uniref:Uncharacterized protein n=1 Tax=Actinomyces johnsonii F0510 TaxID=1227262 RepID=U1RN57_9ACTO|nr:hypothetical protein HMPREF1549_00830 [Actinomyces johnsonii F0510]
MSEQNGGVDHIVILPGPLRSSTTPRGPSQKPAYAHRGGRRGPRP